MTVQDALANGTKRLQRAGIDTARLDILVLLEDLTGCNRASILAHPEQSLTSHQQVVLNKNITQRERHIPLAYIRGRSAFYGRNFAVNSQVLVPRPESESIIELLLAIPFSTPPRIVDIGCGSGCLGITAGLELLGSHVTLCDIDSGAVAVAAKNAQAYDLPVTVLQQDVFADVAPPCDVILANLPYVPDNYPINQAAAFEPRLALFSGQDGLDHYRHLWHQLADTHQKPQHVITEAFPKQHQALERLAASAGYAQKKSEGYAQHFTPSRS